MSLPQEEAVRRHRRTVDTHHTLLGEFGVHPAAHSVAPGGRASRLRRYEGGTPDRAGAAAAVPGGAARRDRENPCATIRAQIIELADPPAQSGSAPLAGTGPQHR